MFFPQTLNNHQPSQTSPLVDTTFATQRPTHFSGNPNTLPRRSPKQPPPSSRPAESALQSPMLSYQHHYHAGHLAAGLGWSMTCDRGNDPSFVCKQATAGQGIACHPELERRLKTDIRFCDPHAHTPSGHKSATRPPTDSSRQFFPKSTDLGHHRPDRTQ